MRDDQLHELSGLVSDESAALEADLKGHPQLGVHLNRLQYMADLIRRIRYGTIIDTETHAIWQADSCVPATHVVARAVSGGRQYANHEED